MRGQGSLEYLLILAAILAIAVVVVLVANSMLGAPGDARIVEQDKYNFAVNGWEVRGYDRLLDLAGGETPGFELVIGEESYGYNGAAPPAGESTSLQATG
jgi:hypothetical protein